MSATKEQRELGKHLADLYITGMGELICPQGGCHEIKE